MLTKNSEINCNEKKAKRAGYHNFTGSHPREGEVLVEGTLFGVVLQVSNLNGVVEEVEAHRLVVEQHTAGLLLHTQHNNRSQRLLDLVVANGRRSESVVAGNELHGGGVLDVDRNTIVRVQSSRGRALGVQGHKKCPRVVSGLGSGVAWVLQWDNVSTTDVERNVAKRSLQGLVLAVGEVGLLVGVPVGKTPLTEDTLGSKTGVTRRASPTKNCLSASESEGSSGNSQESALNTGTPVSEASFNKV